MKRLNGPTKKLAPTIAPNTSCLHRYSDDEGIQLEIECSQCPGAHDLGNSKCLAGVLNVMIAGAEPEAIILKRFIHKRYRGEMVRRAAFASSELAALNRAIAALEPPSDKRCRTCTASPERIVLGMKHKLMEDPSGYASSKALIVREIESTAFANVCGDARACVEKGLRISTLGRG